MIKVERRIFCDICVDEITNRDYRSSISAIALDDYGDPESVGYDICEECTKSFAEWAKSRSKMIAPFDRVSVVRCKDCIHADIFPIAKEKPEAPLKCLDIRYGGVFPNWFCERGERRDSRCKKD